MAKLFLSDKHADHSPCLLKLLWAVESGLVGLLGGLSRLFSPDLASSAGRRLMRRLGPRTHKTRHIRRNLQNAFPEKNALDIDELVRDIWGNLGSILAEYPHLGTICHREAEQRLECVIRGDAQVFRNTGKPAVFVSAHLANWEIAAGALSHLGIPADRGLYAAAESVHGPDAVPGPPSSRLRAGGAGQCRPPTPALP